jgi:hypothetical protein
VRKVMEEVLRVTGPPLDLTWNQPAHGVILGYLQDGRRSLQALLVLGGSDLDDAGDGLTRSMFEKAATAGWLAADIRRFEKLKGAYDFDWWLVRQGWEASNPGEEFVFARDAPLLLGNEPAQPAQLPKIETRARAANLLPYMNAYKLLCMSDHSTLASASFGLDPGPRKRLRLARFGLAGAMAVSLGERVDEVFDLGWEPRLATVRAKMMNLIGNLTAGRQ